MQLNNIHSIYFIGIGGIGMSALARYFHRRGVRVAGYDRTVTALTRQLEAEGMDVHYTADVEGLPQAIDLVVYTPAVPADFPELLAVRERGLPVLKRSEVLGIISRGMQTVAVAGTHGKTTTTTLTAYLLREAGIEASAFLGGISRNFEDNYVHGNSDWVVVEADEYDRSFLRLDPDVAIITAMDADHLEIYGDHDNMLRTGYYAFIEKIKPGGRLIVRYDLDQGLPRGDYALSTFGIGAGDYNAHNVRVEDGWFVFDLRSPEGEIQGLRLAHPGRHNILNATAALAVALQLGARAEDLRRGLESFRGIARRFEFIIREPDLVLIDDYAHHPAELEAAIGAARELYPDRKITGVFQPHLYTRTRDFADGFARALDELDEAIILDIYPAREEPIPGVTSALIFDKMRHAGRRLLNKEKLVETLAAEQPEVVLTLGAGDIDTLVEPLRRQLMTIKARNHG